MTVRANKPAFNIREKLKELDYAHVPYDKMPAGSVIQVFNNIITTRSVLNSVPGSSTISATSGSQYTSFNFTPKSSNSKLLLLSSTFLVGEASNSNDAIVVFATHGGDTIIGSVLNYSGYPHWSSNLDTTFVSFNHLFDSWGTSEKAISIRVQGSAATSNFVVNYPNATTTYVSQFNSPNEHEVTFTIMEIAQ